MTLQLKIQPIPRGKLGWCSWTLTHPDRTTITNPRAYASEKAARDEAKRVIQSLKLTYVEEI